MMRWLKKIKLNKSFVILAFLMNYNLIVNTTPSTLVPTLVSTTTNTSSSATNITLCADRARSCNNSSTQVNRERSAKISSERIKDSADNERTASQFQLRRMSIERVRDNKLMSVLQNRRRIPPQLNTSKDCERNCSSSSDEMCKLRCSQNIKSFGARGRKNSFSVNKNENHSKSIPEEFLETEESVQGLFFVEPASSNKSTSKQTKESSNRNIFSSDDKKAFKDKHIISDPSIEASSVESLAADIRTTTEIVARINRRNKYTRTSYPPSESRSTVYRGRVKFSPSNMRTLEEIESEPYSYIGQKISSPPTRVPEIRRKPQGKKTPIYQSTTPARLKEEELEVMEVSVAKQSSTEKSRFWKARNVVAINNYMKRLNPQLQLGTAKNENVTKLMIKYETVHVNPVRVASSTIVNNEVIKKNIFSRSTSNSSREDLDKITDSSSDSAVHSFPSSGKMPSLIINVPDDATPVFFNDQKDDDLQSNDDESFLEKSSAQYEKTTSPILITSNQENEKKNFDADLTIETTTNFNLVSAVSPKSLNTTNSTITTSTRSTTIQDYTTSFIEPSAPIKTTKRIYTTIPRRKMMTTVYPDYNRTTLSTFLNNISTRRKISTSSIEKNSSWTTTEAPIIETSTQISTYSISKVTSNKTIYRSVKNKISPSTMAPEAITPTSQSDVYEQGVFSTSKADNNQVLVEMYQMNTVTYVMAGLGLLPLIVILVYVVRQYLHRNDHDKNSESYGNDIQPISPVVTLDQNEDSVTLNEEESAILESDFNRSNLRFKSLLGEGNFGQVWKAEADNLMGHLGTTRIVAVKTERINNGQGGLKSECEIMRKLGSHSNVVTLLGFCVEQEPHLLLMEYAMRGRLLSLLRAARGVLNGMHHPPSRQSVMPLSPRRLTGFALDIAKGMEYIAEKKVVHRDLAARNVLLDHNGVCKICDFGMSVDLSNVKSPQRQLKIPKVSSYQNKFKFDMTARVFGGLSSYTSSRARNENKTNKIRTALPIRWMAPEALQHHIYSVETDVFAFGIVLWELSTLGITPYPTLSGREVLRNVPNGVRPDIPPSCRQELSETMIQCWHKNPHQRPSFTESITKLSKALLQWQEDTVTTDPEYIDVSGFSEDYENGMIYFNRRVSEFECEI